MQEETKFKPVDESSASRNKFDDGLSSFIWRTFVGNKKKEDFFRSTIYLLLIINAMLVIFLYTQKTQRSVYVIDSGQPKIANLVESDVRADAQIVFFVKLWMKLLTEVSGDNYEENRETLKKLSSRDLMKRVLATESSTGNRLLKEVMQAETMRLKVLDIVIDRITRRGSVIDVEFSKVTQIDVPTGSEKYVTSHKAQLITTNYRLNGVGLAMVDLDNLWTLQRRI